METSLLRAYLTYNERMRIVLCLSQLHYDRQSVLKEVFPEYVAATDERGLEVTGGASKAKAHFPSSIYLQTV